MKITFLIDNFVVKQQLITIALPKLVAKKPKFDHFLCQKYSKRIMDQKFAEARNKTIKKYLYQALYF